MVSQIIFEYRDVGIDEIIIWPVNANDFWVRWSGKFELIVK